MVTAANSSGSESARSAPTPVVAASASQTSAPTGVVAAGAVQPVGDPQGKAWTLAFDDEFNGTSINSNAWDVYNSNGAVWDNSVSDNPANCSESGGYLRLDYAGNASGCDIASAYGPYDGHQGTQDWELRVGDYMEARIWFAYDGSQTNPCANWPAFWARSTGSSTFAEIDVAECDTTLDVNYHASGTDLHVATPQPVTAWENSWHVYGVYRTASAYYVYWDGNLVATQPATNDGGLPAAVRFTMGYHTGAANTVTGSAGDMLVDWFRGYTGG